MIKGPFKHSFFWIFLLSLTTYLSEASEYDSLLKFNYLKFKSKDERVAFVELKKNREELLSIFLTPFLVGAGTDEAAARKKVDACVNELRVMIADKSEPKKVKSIYNEVHKVFFKVYKLENSFCDIFSKGEYNCVSATALYAIIFSKLGIPYQIKETPRHVYLITYPASYKIMIETTSPEGGYYQYNEDFAKKYVKTLVKSKLISPEEADTASITRLLNIYLFSSEDISLLQLAGLQYTNFGIYYGEKKNYRFAIEEFKKATYLYPSDRSRSMLKEALLFQISNNSYSNMEQVYNLVALCYFNNRNKEDITNEVVRIEFQKVIQAQLIDYSDYQKLDSSYSLVMSALEDTVLRNNISFDYNYELARTGLLSSKDSSYELSHFSAAYRANRNNINLQNMILSYLMIVTERSNNVSEILSMLRSFGRKYDFLQDNNQFNTVKANCLLEMSYRSYVVNDVLAGDVFIKEFEGLNSLQNELSFSDNFIERAYMTGAGIYYKKGNYAQSKQLVKTGLQYAPNSFNLKQMLRQF